MLIAGKPIRLPEKLMTQKKKAPGTNLPIPFWIKT